MFVPKFTSTFQIIRSEIVDQQIVHKFLLLFPRESREVRLLKQEFPERADRRSPEDFSAVNVLAVEDTALAADDRVVIETSVFADSNLTTNQTSRSDRGAS